MKKTIKMTIGKQWDLDEGKTTAACCKEIFQGLERIGVKISKKAQEAAAEEGEREVKDYFNIHEVLRHVKLPRGWDWRVSDGWVSVHRVVKVEVQVPKDVEKAFKRGINLVPEEALE